MKMEKEKEEGNLLMIGNRISDSVTKFEKHKPVHLDESSIQGQRRVGL